jgi:hypothetical protein
MTRAIYKVTMNIGWGNVERVREGMNPYFTAGSAFCFVIGVVETFAIAILMGSLLVGATIGTVFFISGIVHLQLRQWASPSTLPWK